jgi:spoIIIJ-associated protein
MALRLAEVALRTGKALAVGPMSARDRRAVHLALVEVDGVTTRSEGEGIFRQLLVIPGPKPRVP